MAPRSIGSVISPVKLLLRFPVIPDIPARLRYRKRPSKLRLLSAGNTAGVWRKAHADARSGRHIPALCAAGDDVGRAPQSVAFQHLLGPVIRKGWTSGRMVCPASAATFSISYNEEFVQGADADLIDLRSFQAFHRNDVVRLCGHAIRGFKVERSMSITLSYTASSSLLSPHSIAPAPLLLRKALVASSEGKN